MSQPKPAAVIAGILLIGFMSALSAQTPAQRPGGGRGNRGGIALTLFGALDANQDGSLTRDELRASFDKWFTEADTARSGAISQDQLIAVLGGIFPQPPAPAPNSWANLRREMEMVFMRFFGVFCRDGRGDSQSKARLNCGGRVQSSGFRVQDLGSTSEVVAAVADRGRVQDSRSRFGCSN